jgi:penicillin amidase
MPKRIGWTVLTIGVGLLLSVGIIMYLAFSAGPQAPSRLHTDVIDAEATVSWTDEGGVTVQARSLPDALVLLGYGHARSRSWQLALWRQAALGRLSEWFGADALPADRVVRQLGIPDGAQRALIELDTDTKNALLAFSAGLDLAVSAPDLSRGAPFLIMDVEMEPWQPWHSLAIERLFACFRSTECGRTMWPA